MYYAVWASDRPGTLATRMRVREAHRARLREPGAHPVRVVAGGPTLDASEASMNGSLLVIQADSLDDVRAFLAEDPYQLEGVYARVEVRPWQWGLGRPDADPAR